jgi:Mg2+/citrate symporter
MFSRSDIEKYFIAEKQEALVFLIIGSLAIVLGCILYYFLKSNFYKGAAIPLLVVGIIQVVVGATVYARSDRQRVAIVYAYDMDPGKIKNEEIPRMEKVNRNFVMYRWVEAALLISGFALVLAFRKNPVQSFWLGLGITLSIEAAGMLFADRMAEKRANIYTQQLKEFVRGKIT